MHLAVAGPMDLRLLSPALAGPPISRPGYAFPLTSQLVLAYMEAGHRVTAITTDRAVRLPEFRSGPSLDLHILPMRARARHLGRDFMRSERRLVEGAIRSAQPDAVHAHWTYEFALAAQRSGSPHVITVHDWAPAVLAAQRDAYRAMRLLMQARTLSRSSQLTAVSPYIVEKVARYGRGPVSLIPNAVPEVWLAPPREQAAEVRTIGALNVGFTPRKNVTTLLAAFSLLRSEGLARDTILKLAGTDFEPEGAAHRWAVAAGFDANVEFVGPVFGDGVRDYLDSLDVFVHPALEESFGMVLLEAGARGIPVVAGANSGAVPWVIGPGGWLVDVKSATSLARGVSDALRADAAERGKRAATLRHRIEQEFLLSGVRDMYLSALETCTRA